MDDDRVTCETCVHCNVRRRRCLEDETPTDIVLPRRCQMYAPASLDGDKRNGLQRWPQLKRQIELARSEDKVYLKAMKR